ncbi:Ppx/GppA phosphatase family protein [Tepidiphilus margaritifer]|uniref:Ppx/GppA phosphatase family protein n=1 Tax=Tepidiphilus margaritifer TaxID=203471 RepID=UPI0003FEA991|nr:Ppx/GppA phosphatase family protein [Tepidiphilus margaritifer]
MGLFSHLAAVDLGSNSFRLEIARVDGDLLYPVDDLKASVRLAAGLSEDKRLDGASFARGLAALAGFAERLKGFPPEAVRAVGTNALRVARNAPEFVLQGQAVLGYPIEIVSGREEARLIYLGVAHAVAEPQRQTLVIDIGGGSTEIIIGRSFQPILLESLYMGCVSYSLRFFPEGKITESRLREARLAAAKEIEAIAVPYRVLGWERAVGSSGSAKAIRDVLVAQGWSQETITRKGLQQLVKALPALGSIEALKGLKGLKRDRQPVFPGAVAIMAAAFDVLGLDEMVFSEGALRLGVLYDLLGRHHHQDIRESSVERFMERYGVDRLHAGRVETTALGLALDLRPELAFEEHPDRLLLSWAARLHEIGLSIAHAGHHKHGAYILAHADMPGFSRMEQAQLARLVLSHRGKLERLAELPSGSPEWDLIFALRIAAVLHRARDGKRFERLRARREGKGYALQLPSVFLRRHPLTRAALEDEIAQWAGVGMPLRLDPLSETLNHQGEERHDGQPL